MNTLITPDDVISLAFTADEGYRSHLITQMDISTAECRYLIPIIGEALYEELLNGEYGRLLSDYVAPMVAAWTRYTVEPLLRSRCCEAHTSTSAAEVELSEDRMRGLRRIAEEMSRRLTRHLNGDSYPEYNADENPLNRCSTDGGIVQIY